MEGKMITLQEIFSFQHTGIDTEGNVKGIFKFHGVRPRFADKFKVIGVKIPADVFSPDNLVQI